MNSLAIVRALMYHIQSERNPVFRAEGRQRPRRAAYLGLFVNLGVFALLIGSAVIAYLDQGGGFGARENIFGLLLVGGGFALSVMWTVPIAALAGGRVVQTTEVYDVLRVTPLSTHEILLARAAAAVRSIWAVAVGMAIFSLFVAAILGVPAAAIRAHDPVLSAIVLVAGAAATLIERVQEIALAATIGLAAPLVSRSLSLMIGVLGGLLIRVLPLLVILAILPSIAFAEPILAELPEPALVGLWFALSSVAGSIVLLAALPGVQTLAIVGLLIGAREGITRALFAWIERRFRAG